MPKLNSEEAFIFRIIHRENLERVLRTGLHCRNSPEADPAYRNIGSRSIIENRNDRTVPLSPGGTFSDYIPFYFTPWSLMLYNIQTGHNVDRVSKEDLLMVVGRLRNLAKAGHRFVFTNQRWCSADVDFELLSSKDFKRDPDDPGKQLRYQAEAMIHGHIPLADLTGIACASSETHDLVTSKMEKCGIDSDALQTKVLPSWFF